MTESELAAIRERVEAWKHVGTLTEQHSPYGGGPEYSISLTRNIEDRRTASAVSRSIFHAREDIPALLDEIERLREELQCANAALSAMDGVESALADILVAADGRSP